MSEEPKCDCACEGCIYWPFKHCGATDWQPEGPSGPKFNCHHLPPTEDEFCPNCGDLESDCRCHEIDYEECNF